MQITTTAITRKLPTRAWHLLTEARHTSAPAPGDTGGRRRRGRS
jgi:hypothetical protein